MKEVGYEHWNPPNVGATNESDFTGLPAGNRGYTSGSFASLGNYGYFWSSSEAGTSYAWFRSLYHNYDGVNRYDDYKTTGFSVRCLQDGD